MPGMREAIIDLTTLQPATSNFLKFENWETKSTPPIPSYQDFTPGSLEFVPQTPKIVLQDLRVHTI